MTKLPLDKDTILKRINGIQAEISELEKLAKLPFDEFEKGVGFKLAQFHLHRTLEGVFHISAHILSRIPGAQASEYKEMARKLGEYHIINQNFADTALQNMAGYRNRIVHFYADITAKEIYQIINDNMGDFDIFLQGVKKVLDDPEKFGIAKK